MVGCLDLRVFGYGCWGVTLVGVVCYMHIEYLGVDDVLIFFE